MIKSHGYEEKSWVSDDMPLDVIPRFIGGGSSNIHSDKRPSI